jgi:alkylated DNA repair dioxygenase AlkB
MASSASPPTELAWQPSLLASADAGPAVDRSFHGLVRHQLDERAWVDHCPGWVQGPDAVFDEVLAAARWEQHDRLMYGSKVVQPRLNATWPRLPIVEQMRLALSERYGVEFVSGGCNLYRDGRDSVAWHRDRIAEEIADPIVAIVTFGQARPFLMRPRGGGRSVRFLPGPGDLIVTGGTAQRTWEHTIPKQREAGARMSITFRHH